jgi:nucleoside-diphosphate-sugar epimerase
MAAKRDGLTVAVTGPTGTFGFGLMPLLQAEDRVERIIGIARRPFDPLEHGWDKMAYRRGDVQDEQALRDAFEGADVVVHLAFLIVGGSPETTQAINVQGTLNAFRAAAAAGAKRFVYASSIAAYGFHRDNPVAMTEEWPVRPADRLFYAQEKAELEELLAEEAAAHPQLQLYLLRPPIVLGPHAIGGKLSLPGPLAPLARFLPSRLGRIPVPLPVIVPEIPMQFIHEDDVGTAIRQCVLAAGPAGAYNIAGEGTPTLVEVAKEFGFLPIAVPARPAYRAARALAQVPYLPSAAGWIEAFSHPAIMDITKARTKLGWTPQFTGIEALRDTLNH